MKSSDKTLSNILHLLKKDVVLPYVSEHKKTGFFNIRSLSVNTLLDKLSIKRSELDDILYDLRAKGFIHKYKIEANYGLVGDIIYIVPTNDFMGLYDKFFDKDFTQIIVDEAEMTVEIDEQLVKLNAEVQVDIIKGILSAGEEVISYSELDDRPTKTTMNTIRNHFKDKDVALFKSVGNKSVEINSTYLNRFKPPK